MDHHTKTKGDLGVLKAQVDLAEQGYTILIPLSEHAPFDFVAYKEGRFKRVQVKYRSLYRGGIALRARSTWSDASGVHIREVDKHEFDLYCIYCPETDECYYLNPEDFDKSVTLRVETPKNNQRAGIRLASDCRRVP